MPRKHRGLADYDYPIRDAADRVEQAVAKSDCAEAREELLSAMFWAGHLDDEGSSHLDRAQKAFDRSCVCAPRAALARRRRRRRT